MKKSVIHLFLLMILISFCSALLLDTGYEDVDYGPPYEIFMNNETVYTITPETFTGESVAMNVEVSQRGGFIYKFGFWHNTREWVPFEFSQETYKGTDWIENDASTLLTINANNNLKNGLNPIVIYSCIKENYEWKCGCVTENDCEYWRLQLFNVSDIVNEGIGMGCVYDSDCGGNLTCTNSQCYDSNGSIVEPEPECEINGDCVAGQECISSYCVNIFEEGSGTSADPYVIKTIQDLQNMNKILNAHYILANDINAFDTNNWNEGKGFNPIGKYRTEFTGSLDGKGYIISNLYVSIPLSTSGGYNGLFGATKGYSTIIKNVNLENVYISGSGGYTGALVGDNNQATIENCSSSGTITAPWGSFGGLVGRNYNGFIKKSSSSARVYYYYYANTFSAAGGLVGQNQGGRITNKGIQNSFATGSVSGQGRAGGLVGWNKGLVRNSYATGTTDVYNGMSSHGAVGGLVGYNDDGPITGDEGVVENCFSTGTVYESYDTIDYVYSGGLIGQEKSTASNTNSYWYNNPSDSISNCIGDPASSCGQMPTATTFYDNPDNPIVNWDFDNVWQGNTRVLPTLR